ncbi:MAG: 3-hydroxyisobutyrate dehydrogenase, partial [Microvirga sp.]
MTTIAFIGLGNMGGPMAANLVKAGDSVIGFDLVAASCEAAKAEGVRIAGSGGEAVREADVIVTMLPAGKHVLAVWQDLLPAAKPGMLIIDSSTIDVESARKAHAMAKERGCRSLDAPVSGGVGGAKAASLTFMCGGTGNAFAQAEPILAKMGKRVVHCGEAGAGQAAKICNNMILGATMAVTCEGFVLAQKLGLDPQVFFDISSKASGQSWSMTSYAPVPGVGPETPADHDYDGGFAAALMLKDLKLALEAAEQAGVPVEMGEEAEEVYEEFVAKGGGSKD